MIEPGKFHTNTADRQLCAHVTYYTRDEDGSFYIPSLAYGRPHGEEARHFCCDESGYGAFEEGYANRCIQAYYKDGDTEQYQTYDDLPSALNDILVNPGNNNHVVMDIPEVGADDRTHSVTLIIYWWK